MLSEAQVERAALAVEMIVAASPKPIPLLFRLESDGLFVRCLCSAPPSHGAELNRTLSLGPTDLDAYEARISAMRRVRKHYFLKG